MIDIESIVIDTVSKAVKTAYSSTYPGLTICGFSVDVPSSFPCVTIEETGNSTYQKTQDESLTEHQAIVTYDINVYANDASKKKSVAKKIADTVDQTMQSMNFTRRIKSPTPNVDRSIYRFTLRYEAIVGAKVGTGSSAVYPIYRR